MEILVNNLQSKQKINLPIIRRRIRQILQALNISQRSLSVVFVTDKKIHSINNEYLGHDYPTDIVTFDLLGDDPRQQELKAKRRARVIEGELFISVETAASNAKEYKVGVLKEITLYIVHGVLHLVGYDDHSEKDIRFMRKKEKELLNLFYK